MLNSKEVFQKNKGFTLIELLLWLCLFSILMGAYLSLLQYSNNMISRGDRKDEILIHGRYGIEFIKDEILSADKIIPSYKFENLDSKYENSFNFVIHKKTITKNDKDIIVETIYNYSTYYLKNDELRRAAVNTKTEKLPKGGEFSGDNQVCRNVLDISGTRLDRLKGTININLSMGYEDEKIMDFKSLIYPRCSIER